MMVLAEEYLAALAEYDGLRQAADRAVRTIVDGTGVKTHSVSSRVKSFESCQSKLIALGSVIPKRADLERLNDLVGVRVVCYFRRDVETVAAALACDLLDARVHDHTAEFHESKTGYQSSHIIARLPEASRGGHLDIPIEIQVRTVGMDAWASISHLLAYKTDASVPPELLARFKALSGLFYVADNEFEALYALSQKAGADAAELVSASQPSSLVDEPTTLESLGAYVDSSFPERERSPRSDVAELTADLLHFGYNTVAAVDQMVADNTPVALREEEDYARLPHFSRVGIVRVALSHAVGENVYNRHKGWGFLEDDQDCAEDE